MGTPTRIRQQLPWIERLMRRGSAPIGVINVASLRRQAVERSAWVGRRFPLPARLAARVPADDEAEGAEAAVAARVPAWLPDSGPAVAGPGSLATVWAAPSAWPAAPTGQTAGALPSGASWPGGIGAVERDTAAAVVRIRRAPPLSSLPQQVPPPAAQPTKPTLQPGPVPDAAVPMRARASAAARQPESDPPAAGAPPAPSAESRPAPAASSALTAPLRHGDAAAAPGFRIAPPGARRPGARGPAMWLTEPEPAPVRREAPAASAASVVSATIAPAAAAAATAAPKPGRELPAATATAMTTTTATPALPAPPPLAAAPPHGVVPAFRRPDLPARSAVAVRLPSPEPQALPAAAPRLFPALAVRPVAAAPPPPIDLPLRPHPATASLAVAPPLAPATPTPASAAAALPATAAPALADSATPRLHPRDWDRLLDRLSRVIFHKLALELERRGMPRWH